MRLAFVAVVASLILVAGIATVSPIGASDDRGPIKVDATSVGGFEILLTTAVEDHTLRSRHAATPLTITGEGLNGAILTHQAFLGEPVAPTTHFWVVSIASCTGCVDGHTGTLFWRHYFEGKNVDGVVSWTGTWDIIKGTGDLEGVRGGGSSDGGIISGVVTTFYEGKIYFDNNNNS